MIRLMKLRLFVLIAAANIVVAGGLVTDEAHACSCAPITPKESFQNSDAVFQGEVVAFEPAKSATFDVEASWKGDVQDPEVVNMEGTGGGGCGINFVEGKSYLVFAYRASDGGNDYLRTDNCTGTTRRDNVERVSKLFGPPTENLPDTGGPGLSPLAPFVAAGALAVSALAVSAGVISARRRP